MLTVVVVMIRSILLLLILTLNTHAKNERLINKDTVYEAKLFEEKDSLYMRYQGKKSLVAQWCGEAMLCGEKLDYKVEDINFDGFDDIAVLVSLGYGGVNYFYSVYLANEKYEIASFAKEPDISNYELYPSTKTLLSEYKSGPRHFTELYVANEENELKHYVTYENYEEDDMCFIKSIHSRYADINGILSCKGLLEKHEEESLFARVTVKKALLYDKVYGDEANGMYLIKDDVVELIDGEYGDSKYLVKYRGKRVITKYVDASKLKVVAKRHYAFKHDIFFYRDESSVAGEDSLYMQDMGHKKYYFSLDTIGNNAHMCQMEGMARDKGKYLEYKGENDCFFKFYKTDKGLKTEDINHECKKEACGIHAFVGGIEFEELR